MPGNYIQSHHVKRTKQRQLKIVVVIVSIGIFFGWLYWISHGHLIQNSDEGRNDLWQYMKGSGENVLENYNVLKQQAEAKYSQVEAIQEQEEVIIEKMKDKIASQQATATTTTTTSTEDLTNNREIDVQEVSQ